MNYKMQQYQKTYFDGMGYGEINFNDITSEVSGQVCRGTNFDIHHIKFTEYHVPRQEYPVERLILLTREEHIKYGDNKKYFDWLLWSHHMTMTYRNIEFKIRYLPDHVFYWSNGYDWLYKFYKKIYDANLCSTIVYDVHGVTVSVHENGTELLSEHGDTKNECIDELYFQL